MWGGEAGLWEGKLQQVCCQNHLQEDLHSWWKEQNSKYECENAMHSSLGRPWLILVNADSVTLCVTRPVPREIKDFKLSCCNWFIFFFIGGEKKCIPSDWAVLNEISVKLWVSDIAQYNHDESKYQTLIARVSSRLLWFQTLIARVSSRLLWFQTLIARVSSRLLWLIARVSSRLLWFQVPLSGNLEISS